MSRNITPPPIVSPAEWQAAHEALLVREKAPTRRRQPMARIVKQYVFDGNHGTVGPIDLFVGRRQLIFWKTAKIRPWVLRRDPRTIGGGTAVDALPLSDRQAPCPLALMARIDDSARRHVVSGCS